MAPRPSPDPGRLLKPVATPDAREKQRSGAFQTAQRSHPGAAPAKGPQSALPSSPPGAQGQGAARWTLGTARPWSKSWLEQTPSLQVQPPQPSRRRDPARGRAGPSVPTLTCAHLSSSSESGRLGSAAADASARRCRASRREGPPARLPACPRPPARSAAATPRRVRSAPPRPTGPARRPRPFPRPPSPPLCGRGAPWEV